jgi:phage terminase large subunit-like protein
LSHAETARQYCADVVGGVIPASQWVKLSCAAHLDGLTRQDIDEEYRYTFDTAAADRVCQFAELLPHVKGQWARRGECLRLAPWQAFFLGAVFGWKHKATGLRRYRKALLFVPRKNGKSHLSAVVGLYMLTADNEHGAEVYAGATTERQSWEVFRPARLMAKNADFIDAFGVLVNASNIAVEDTASRFEPLIGKPGDGSSPSCALVDEYHEHASDEMVDTLETGMGAREQPLMVITTTAGSDLSGPCYQLQLDAQKVLTGVVEDDPLFSLIYCADPDDQWDAVTSVTKANPNYGVSVSGDFLTAQLNTARANSRKQSVFKAKHLNQWIGTMSAFFNVERWRDGANPDLRIEDFAGRPCYLGLDLASRVDIAALEIIFPEEDGGFTRFGKYYLPESSIASGDNEHYAGWAVDGHLTLNDGEMIDFKAIEADIVELCTVYDVRRVAVDPFQASMLLTELMKHGVPVIETRQIVLNMSEPMKHLGGLVMSRKIRHDGDPVMEWMISNVVAKIDAKDNVYPRKERQGSKIDGVVALIMAIGRSMLEEEDGLDEAIDNMICGAL